MPAFKMSAARIYAGLAASAFFTPAFAATLVVNSETPLDISTPPGFTYTVGGGGGSLAVSTEGFLLCANIYSNGPEPTPVTVMPQHGDWRMPVAQDVQAVVYNGGTLGVNRGLNTSLVCHAVGPEGEVASAFSDGMLRNGFDSKAAEQFGNMINWIPSAGFSWNNPNWSLVPTDLCSPTAQQPASVVEDVACAGVAGLRPAGAGATTRDPTLWTYTDGLNFYYVARIDARFGPQSETEEGPAGLPISTTAAAPDGATSATLSVVDAYDRGIVGVGGGYLSDLGQWCALSDAPATLGGNVCVGAPASGTLSGPLGDFSINLSAPPLGIGDTSFYMVFIRSVVGAPPTVDEPAVAVSILLEPSVIAEGGDRFRGDDVAFGFMPSSQGFPWMHGQ